MSYAHSDDDEGQLTAFCERLERELRVQTGRKDVEIFMDADIEVGMLWRGRIEEGLGASTFLLPIVTPSFLASDYCCDELHAFSEQGQALGRGDLILPIYYVECDEFRATTTNERAEATWEAISSRQLFPWWHLRHKDPSTESVREELAKLAKQIHKAMSRPKPVKPAVEPAQPKPIATSVPPRPPELLLDDLFDPDPVKSRPAAKAVAARGSEAIPAVVERLQGMGEPTRLVVRDLLSRFPGISGPLMIERIEGADQHWQLATEVPECFGPEHAPVCEDRLADLMNDDASPIDVVRKAIDGLGYVGSIDRAPEVARFLRDQADALAGDLYDKYYGYCVTALARVVCLAPMEAAYKERVSLGFEYLEPAVRLVSARGWQSIVYPNMQSILSRCKPHHGDRFVSSWLTSDNEDMRNLGAYALGGIGLGWAAPALLERCADPAESIAVRRTSTFAAGVIGGAETLDRLRALQLHDETLVAIRDDALTMCIGDAKDEAQFRDLARDLIARSPSELCWVYRAIGLRGDDALLGLVRDGLRAKETSVRGDAALALARLAGPSEADALRRAREEASSTRENLLASLALLTIGEELPGDPELEQLRSMLDAESFMYRSVTQQDILAALRSSPHPLAVGIADAWQPIYDSSSAY